MNEQVWHNAADEQPSELDTLFLVTVRRSIGPPFDYGVAYIDSDTLEWQNDGAPFSCSNIVAWMPITEYQPQ